VHRVAIVQVSRPRVIIHTRRANKDIVEAVAVDITGCAHRPTQEIVPSLAGSSPGVFDDAFSAAQVHIRASGIAARRSRAVSAHNNIGIAVAVDIPGCAGSPTKVVA